MSELNCIYGAILIVGFWLMMINSKLKDVSDNLDRIACILEEDEIY